MSCNRSRSFLYPKIVKYEAMMDIRELASSTSRKASPRPCALLLSMKSIPVLYARGMGLISESFTEGSPVRQHREIHVKSSCYVSYDGCLRDELCGSWDDEVLLCMRERATSCDWRIFVNSNRE